MSDRSPTALRRGLHGRRRRGVLHAATLHKPHVATHARQDFVDTNITGTLTLLEAAVAAGVAAFVFTSTTSAFGRRSSPPAGEPAAWVTEDVVPVPKNIYGVTKARRRGPLRAVRPPRPRLPVHRPPHLALLPRGDDDPAVRGAYDDANSRRTSCSTAASTSRTSSSAHLLARRRRRRSASAGTSSPRRRRSPPTTSRRSATMRRRSSRASFPEFPALYAARGWRMFGSIDRVYVNRRAVTELGWRPSYDFASVLDSLRSGEDFRSPLAREVGAKGYHDVVFAEGPYPVA